jgi:endonuclease/exonuclease/phosphatase (EEP) superfamily protein YafD
VISTPSALTDRAPDGPHDVRRRVLVVLAGLAELLALAGLAAHYYVPGDLYLLALAAFSPYLGAGALIAAALWAFVTGPVRWIGVATSAVVLVWTVALQLPLYVAQSVPPGRDVVVMTANLRLGSADPAAVVDAVRAHGVDVLMLEELTEHEQNLLTRAGLDRLMPHHLSAPRGRAAGTGLWSRYPLLGAQLRSGFGSALVIARVQVPGIAVAPTAVALHVFGPYPSDQTAQWDDEIARLRDVLRALPTGAPALVGGDFNATPDVAQFRAILDTGFADAADQAGAGPTPTYPADRTGPPLIAIDHVLTHGAVAHRADSLKISGSDHRALLVTVRLPR